MKLKIISDVHLENFKKSDSFQIGEGDTIILAGNILIAKHLKLNNFLKEIYINFFDLCIKNYNNVLYVMGNHEHYGYHFNNTYTTIKENIPRSIHLLENQHVIIDDWTFIGMTMWTDYDNNHNSIFASEKISNDYELIRTDLNYRKIKPADIIATHNESKKYLNKELKKCKNNKVFIITHQAPSIKSISEKCRSEMIYNSYYSDLTKIINRNPQIKYWVHGHTHNINDYTINKCRVLSSPYSHSNTCTFDIF
jgi:predicted phosphodiesterase